MYIIITYITAIYEVRLPLLCMTFICFVNVFKKSHIHAMDFEDLQRARHITEMESHRDIVQHYYDQRKNWKTSNLGTVMFKNGDPDMFLKSSRLEKNYTILVWRFTEDLRKRHLQGFNTTRRKRKDVLKDCPVKNCKFTESELAFPTVDAVIIPMQNGMIPCTATRIGRQRWIFMFDESPLHKLSLSLHSKNTQARRRDRMINLFNWTMTYRSDSDIPIPFGRTVPLSKPIEILMENPEEALKTLVPFWNDKQFVVLISVPVDECNSGRRNSFVEKLREHISLDFFEGYSLNKHFPINCPRYSIRGDLNLVSEYVFHLVRETYSCRQYITEKIFYHAYTKGAIPIIMGVPLEDCLKLLPPNSFLYVDNYRSPEYLAKHVLEIAADPEKLLSFHLWRKHFNVTNEHGLHGGKSQMFCRVCEALNYNDGEAFVYDFDNLMLYFDENLLCISSYSKD